MTQLFVVELRRQAEYLDEPSEEIEAVVNAEDEDEARDRAEQEHPGFTAQEAVAA